MRGRPAGWRSATMGCGTASPLSGRCRTTAASAEIRCAAAAAASPGAATTAPASSTVPAAAAVRRTKAAGLRSCAAPRFDVQPHAALAHHHAAVQEQQQLGGRAAGGGGGEQPVELVGLVADLVAMQRDAGNIVARPGFRAAGGDGTEPFRLD